MTNFERLKKYIRGLPTETEFGIGDWKTCICPHLLKIPEFVRAGLTLHPETGIPMYDGYTGTKALSALFSITYIDALALFSLYGYCVTYDSNSMYSVSSARVLELMDRIKVQEAQAV